MRKYILLLGAAVALCASAAEHVIDLRQSEVALPSPAVGDTLDVRIPDGPEFALRIVSAPPAGIAGQSFVARDDASGASAVVKRNARGFKATIDDVEGARIWSVRITPDGRPSVSSAEKGDGPEECATCAGEASQTDALTAETPSQGQEATTKRTKAGSGFTAAEHIEVVDILVAFDQGAKAWAEKGSNWGNGGDTIEEFADYAVNKMNTVLACSQLDDKFCYRLAGVTEIDDTWTEVNGTALGSLRAREGKLAKLSGLREKYGADVITLLIDKTTGTTSGIAYGYYLSGGFDVPSKFDNYACNVCDIKNVYSRYTMSHETGHNMGCGHSNRQGSNSGPGRYPDSCGYHFTDAYDVRRGTIMAYAYTADDNYSYNLIPYFSTPEISPTEYGCALGVEGTNNNRRTLLETYADTASLREHVLPYDWDVRFLDDNGNDIPDGKYFYSSCYVTLTNANSEAEIYYTLDGSSPTTDSPHGGPGTKVYMYLVNGPKTLTACAVVDGKAESVRSITLCDGHTWSGDVNGNGLWLNNDTSVRPWNGEYYGAGDVVMFPDLAGVSCATVTLKSAVAPGSVAFAAYETAYTFASGDDAATITIPDACFAPAGNVTFEVPVLLAATAFTNLAGRTIAFNAPFGQTVDGTGGYCTNGIVVGEAATLIVAPGKGKTQTFDKFNTATYYSTATVRIGEGNVVFNGPYDSGFGVFGNAQVVVGNGANLVFNCAAATGYGMTSSFTVEKGATVTFAGSMEHMRRPLNLAGGALISNSRFDRMYGPGISVTDDSEIKGNGYILIRHADETITVAEDKTLTIDLPTQDGANTSGWGIVKRGAGTVAVNKELKHSGVTDIEEGAMEVGYSSGSSLYGQGWIVASNATLKVNGGCTLKVPTLTLDETATVSVSAASSAPVVATNNVSVAGVLFELADAGDLSAGDSFPLLKGQDGIAGAAAAKTSRLPELGAGLKWKLEVEDGTLYAKVVVKPEVESAVKFVSNNDSLALEFPDDATLASGGGAQIDASPIVVDGLSTKAVSIAVKFVVPETPPSDVATICSWRVGDCKIYCVRETTGKLNCRWIGADGSLRTTANQTNDVALATGEHLLQIGYYSNSDNGGTRVLLDGEVAYIASGLKFSSDSVSRIAFGATAETSPRYPYAGLVIRETAVLDVASTEPAPRMTASGGSIAYRLNVPGTIPRVFPLTPSGALALDETVVEATFAETNGEASVSVMASFPADKVGTVCGMWVQRTTAANMRPVAIQAEYDGAGKFYLRFNDNSLNSDAATRLAETTLDVSEPHLYTLTFKAGEGATLYQDGVALLMSQSAFSGYPDAKVVSPVTFGCGPYHYWRGTSWHDYPNPAKGFSLYASHIAIGTSDRAVSEEAVEASMAAEEPEVPVAQTRLPTVDVLVAYDGKAVTYVGNTGKTLEAFAEEQIAKMNAVLATNRLDACYTYRLAGVCSVDAEYGDINATVPMLKNGEGALVKLRTARELCGADTVTLLVNTSGVYLGHSCQVNYKEDVSAQHDDAFSVCAISWVDSDEQHTMIHENAHTMGCGHAREQYTAADLTDPEKYSYGYYFKDGDVTRHTIMAYGNNASWYFSSSTGEEQFGIKLGDATNDNARVLRETCGAVSRWREPVKPFADEVMATDADGNEVLNGRVFATNITVALAAPASGASILYTLDGSAPALDSATTFTYSAPLEITDGATLTVSALVGQTISPARTIRLFRIDEIPSWGVWRTSAKYPWTVDGEGLRSYNHTNLDVFCTTPLAVEVAGPKRLKFKHMSYFLTPDTDSNWSHIDVLLDDSVAFTTNYYNTAWSDDVAIDIPDGTHDVQFVYSQLKSMHDPLVNKDGNPLKDEALWLKDFSLEDADPVVVSTVLDIPFGASTNLADVSSEIETVTGEGTLMCGATIPPKGYGLTSGTWKGTVSFEGLQETVRNFNPGNYGNASSCVLMTNCAVSELSNGGTFDGVFRVEGASAFSTKDGYSSAFNVFGVLEGDGDMRFTGAPTQGYVFNVATNYTGSITVANAGRRIVFGYATAISGIPNQAGLITVKPAATASIGANATWYAYHGVNITGTLLVKGAGATLDCDSKSAAIGLKIESGAKLRFDAADAKLTFARAPQFSTGTVKILFGDGVAPVNGATLIDWSSTGAPPMGEFEFADSSLNDGWTLSKTTAGLVVSAKKPADRFDVPNTEAYIVPDAALNSWLDDANFDFYEGTWQEFMEETGANGYVNWMNYVLGLPAADPTAKVRTKISFDAEGKVVVSVADSIPNAPAVDGLKVVCTLLETDDLKSWPDAGVSQDGKVVTVAKASGGRFFRVKVEVQSP